MNSYYSVLLLLVLLSTERCDRRPPQIVAYVETEVITVEKTTYLFKEEKIAVGREATLTAIRENPELATAIKEAVTGGKGHGTDSN